MLRHIFGFVVGIILAPTLPYAMGWGTDTALRTFAENFGATNRTYLAMGVLLVSGIVVAAMTSTRWLSPIAALVVGLPMLVVTALHLLGAEVWVLVELPGRVATLNRLGVLGMLGALLVVSALPAHRWRGREKGEAPDPSYLEPPPMPQPAEAWPSGPQPPGGFAPPSGPPRPPGDPVR